MTCRVLRREDLKIRLIFRRTKYHNGFPNGHDHITEIIDPPKDSVIRDEWDDIELIGGEWIFEDEIPPKPKNE